MKRKVLYSDVEKRPVDTSLAFLVVEFLVTIAIIIIMLFGG